MLALAIIAVLAPGPPGDNLSRAVSVVPPVDYDAATDETGRVRPVDIRRGAGVRRGDRSCVSLAPPARRVVGLRKESVAFLKDSIQLGWCPNVGLGDDVANRLLVTVGGRSAGLDTTREGDVGCDHLVPPPGDAPHARKAVDHEGDAVSNDERIRLRYPDSVAGLCPFGFRRKVLEAATGAAVVPEVYCTRRLRRGLVQQGAAWMALRDGRVAETPKRPAEASWRCVADVSPESAVEWRVAPRLEHPSLHGMSVRLEPEGVGQARLRELGAHGCCVGAPVGLHQVLPTVPDGARRDADLVVVGYLDHPGAFELRGVVGVYPFDRLPGRVAKRQHHVHRVCRLRLVLDADRFVEASGGVRNPDNGALSAEVGRKRDVPDVHVVEPRYCWQLATRARPRPIGPQASFACLFGFALEQLLRPRGIRPGLR